MFYKFNTQGDFIEQVLAMFTGFSSYFSEFRLMHLRGKLGRASFYSFSYGSFLACRLKKVSSRYTVWRSRIRRRAFLPWNPTTLTTLTAQTMPTCFYYWIIFVPATSFFKTVLLVSRCRWLSTMTCQTTVSCTFIGLVDRDDSDVRVCQLTSSRTTTSEFCAISSNTTPPKLTKCPWTVRHRFSYIRLILFQK